MISKIPASQHVFTVVHQFPHGREWIDLRLLGGYSNETVTIVLFRQIKVATNAEVGDGLMELVNKGRSVRPVTDEKLMLDVESGDWTRYADLATGTEFVLGGKRWIKHDPDDIAQLLRSRLYAH